MIALVRVASTANIASLSGLGTAVDGVTLSAGNRVLVKNQNTPSQNGIYVAASGSWSRASDSITAGLLCYVQEGTSNADQMYMVTTANPINVGSTSISFAQMPNLNPTEAIGVRVDGATTVQDAATVTVTSNNLAFPNNANVLLLSTATPLTINSVSNVKPGAVYYLMVKLTHEDAKVTIAHNSAIHCGGFGISPANDDILEILGLESNKVSVISGPKSQNINFPVEVVGNTTTIKSHKGGKLIFEAFDAGGSPLGEQYSWDMDVIGRGNFRHLIGVTSGEPDKFGKTSDHSHFEQNILGDLVSYPQFEPLLGVAQLLRRYGGWDTDLQDSNKNYHSLTCGGKSRFAARSLYGGSNQVSIDTTSTTQFPGAPGYYVGVYFYYDTEIPIGDNTPVQLQIKNPVAGLQAANYSGWIREEPTLVGGSWRILCELVGFDPQHWDWNDRANATDENASWSLYVVDSAAAEDNADSLTTNYQGRSDQILVTFTTPHGLALSEPVVVLLPDDVGGFSGLEDGKLHSGYVSQIVSSTQVAIVVGLTQWPHPVMSGSITGNSPGNTRFLILKGTEDPGHTLVLGAQNWTFWRDHNGVTTRHQVGPMTEAMEPYSAAYGVGVRNETANSVEIGYANNKINISSAHVRLNPGVEFTKGALVQDTKVITISSNNLAFPDDANVILVGAGTVNTVSNVKAGAVYHLVATGSVTLTDGSLIVCKGSSNVTLAVDESVTVIGLESNKISVIS